MKIVDNTLYVTTQKTHLALQKETVVVRVNREVRLRLPLHTIRNIVCFGNVSCTPFLMGACGRAGIGLSFLSSNGRFLARMHGPQSGNVLLRRAQHRATSDARSAAAVARCMVAAKVANSRVVLQRALRDHAEKLNAEAVGRAVDRLGRLLEELEAPLELDRVRGVEGEAAAIYFGVFDHLVLAQKDAFRFKERSRRPPMDSLNALLSFLYAILANDAVSACETAGLDPQMGFLHADRPGRYSLGLDLMEEFRAVIADRLGLSLVNRQQVQAKGFAASESGGVRMDDETRKVVLVAYQKRKAEEMIHPFLGEKMTLGLMPYVQARLLARWLRGDLDAYPAFFWS